MNKLSRAISILGIIIVSIFVICKNNKAAIINAENEQARMQWVADSLARERQIADSLKIVGTKRSYGQIASTIENALKEKQCEYNCLEFEMICGWAKKYGIQHILDELNFSGMEHLRSEIAVYNRYNLSKKYGKTRMLKAISVCNNYGDVCWDDVETILSRSVRIGFTKEMCRLAWGAPEKINRTTTKWGTSEQWCYPSGNYLYFDDGKLSTIQN